MEQLEETLKHENILSKISINSTPRIITLDIKESPMYDVAKQAGVTIELLKKAIRRMTSS